MTKFLSIISLSLVLIPSLVIAGVEFKDQEIKPALVQAKAEKKLIFVSFTAETGCAPCKWMKANVYNDNELGNTVNSQMIPIKSFETSVAYKLDALKLGIKMIPTAVILNENGEIVLKVEGKKSLEEMKSHVNKVLTENCTGLDQKLDEILGTSKASKCCEGLVKNEGNLCVKRTCIENSETPIAIKGDVRKMDCCDDSKRKKVLFNSKAPKVICVDLSAYPEINQGSRNNWKQDLPNGGKKTNSKKSSGASGIGH